MAASTSSFSKLSAPLRHILLRQSAVTLSGKIAADRALPVFASYQKPVLDVAGFSADNTMLFKRVDSPVTRTATELAMKKKGDDSADEDVPFDGSDDDVDDDSCSDFDDDFDDSADDVDVSDDE